MNSKLTYGKNQIAWRRAQVSELGSKRPNVYGDSQYPADKS